MFLDDDNHDWQAPLLEAATSGRCIHRRIAALSAAPQLADQLQGDLHSPSRDDRLSACVRLTAAPDARANTELIELTLNDPDREVRSAATVALAQNPEALRELTRRSDDREVVLGAIEHLRCPEALLELTAHPDIEVGLAAMASLGCPDARHAAACVLVEHEDERAQILALAAFAEVGDKGDLPRVERCLASTRGRVKSAAVETRQCLRARD